MMKKILQRAAGNPRIYDKVQLVAGVRYVHCRIATHTRCFDPHCLVLDAGGGTGSVRSLWANTCTYVCLDINIQKLHGFKLKYPDGTALLADATRTPIRNGSVDVVLCIGVAHHLSGDLLMQFVNESRRILKGAGRLILLDAIWRPRRWAGQLLWRYDRGSNPRTAEALLRILSSQYKIIHRESFSLIHEYILCIGAVRSARASSSDP
jgi:ubiquinone/menaquinone biosynthesis C-methylase UbiE